MNGYVPNGDFKEFDKLLCWLVIGIAAMIFSVIMSGCKCHEMPVPMERIVSDSVVIRDTMFKERLIPYKDSVSLPDTSSFLSNPYAYSYASYSNGLLNHSLGIWPFATVRVQVPYFIEKTRRVEIPKPYPVEKKLSWWERTKIDFGGYAIGTVVITILIVVGKLVYKLKKGG